MNPRCDCEIGDVLELDASFIGRRPLFGRVIATEIMRVQVEMLNVKEWIDERHIKAVFRRVPPSPGKPLFAFGNES